MNFSLDYGLYRLDSRWYHVLVQTLFPTIKRQTRKFIKDQLILSLIYIFVYFLSTMYNYIVYRSWNVFFYYNVYRFLCNPLTFEFDDDAIGFLLIKFYLLTCQCVICLISKLNINEFVSKCGGWISLLVTICIVIIDIFVCLKILILWIIASTIASFILKCSFVFVLAFLIKLLISRFSTN